MAEGESKANSENQGPLGEPRRIGRDEVSPVVEMLTRAFDDDPVSVFMMGTSDSRRAKGLRTFFRIQMLATYLRIGHVYSDPDHRSASLWTPPDAPRPGLRDLIALAPMLRFILDRRFTDKMALLGEVERRRPREPHWYLGVLGTDPDWQGKGYGSRSLKPVLQRCDAEGTPAYLESSKETNVPFYERHGWKVTGKAHAPHGGPTLWLMWRDPRPS
jgi:GNAT superfamily N-acetyltransferase